MKTFYVFFHGLNNHPEIWEKSISLLKAQNNSYCLKLKAHEKESHKWMPVVELRDWEEEIDSLIYQLVPLTSEYEQVHFIGYSLGASLFYSFLQKNEQTSNKQLKSQVKKWRVSLFAPATDLRPIAHIFKILLLPAAFNIPSLLPVSDRAHKGTSLGAYRALIKNNSNLSNKGLNSFFKDIDLQVYCDPRDELVSYKKLQKRFGPYLHPIKSQAKYHHHLISNFQSEEFVNNYLK